MTELDELPTEKELYSAYDELASEKAPGNDNIPAKILKENNDFLLFHLHKLLITLAGGREPKVKKDATIIITTTKVTKETAIPPGPFLF